MRLIDADALMRDMGVADAVKYGNKTAEQQHNSYSTLMKYEIADYIEDAPTIEAEPVVRCKECKYSKKFNITGNRYCEFHVAYEYPVSDDDYCSNGEKMDLEG